jgi:hypothetical protein
MCLFATLGVVSNVVLRLLAWLGTVCWRRDHKLRDARRQFVSILSYGVPWLIFVLFGFMCRRRGDRHCEAPRLLAESCRKSSWDSSSLDSEIFCRRRDARRRPEHKYPFLRHKAILYVLVMNIQHRTLYKHLLFFLLAPVYVNLLQNQLLNKPLFITHMKNTALVNHCLLLSKTGHELYHSEI